MPDQKPREAILFRERKGGEGEWSRWKLAELGITSLLVKAQDRPDEYEVSHLVEKVPEEPGKGLVVSIDLGELWTDGNVDDRIADIVAAKLLEQVGQEARERIADHVRSLRADVIREQVEPIVRAELEKPITLTNRYGEATPGAEPVTLVDLIQREVKKFMSSPARNSGSLRDTETELGKMIREAVGREFKGELNEAVKEAKAQALEKVRQAAGDVIAESVRRAGGML